MSPVPPRNEYARCPHGGHNHNACQRRAAKGRSRIPPVCTHRPAAFAIAALALIAAHAGAQGISPNDDQERVRFARVTQSVERAGFKAPLIVGHGDGATDWLFVLLATRGDSGVLVATADPGSSAAEKPVILERDRDPAQFGVRGIQFGRFLGIAGLYDVEIRHEPHQLEMSRSYSTHHIIRRGDAGLVHSCEYGGGMSSSSSKGIGSISSVRTVTVEKVRDAPALAFDVKVIDETTERRNRDTVGTVTAHSELRTHYELPAQGTCREVK
jgi:hypothetical protein